MEARLAKLQRLSHGHVAQQLGDILPLRTRLLEVTRSRAPYRIRLYISHRFNSGFWCPVCAPTHTRDPLTLTYDARILFYKSKCPVSPSARLELMLVLSLALSWLIIPALLPANGRGRSLEPIMSWAGGSFGTRECWSLVVMDPLSDDIQWLHMFLT
jgi:hypothetical protein